WGFRALKAILAPPISGRRSLEGMRSPCDPAFGGLLVPHVAHAGGYAMRTFDLSPLYRSTIGFDRLFSLLDQTPFDGTPGYPPYNIERTGENAYRISLAVAGFDRDDLSIVAKENTLTIRGEKTEKTKDEKSADVLYQGIASRTFERAFQLADYVQVTGAA